MQGLTHPKTRANHQCPVEQDFTSNTVMPQAQQVADQLPGAADNFNRKLQEQTEELLAKLQRQVLPVPHLKLLLSARGDRSPSICNDLLRLFADNCSSLAYALAPPIS